MWVGFKANNLVAASTQFGSEFPGIASIRFNAAARRGSIAAMAACADVAADPIADR